MVCGGEEVVHLAQLSRATKLSALLAAVETQLEEHGHLTLLLLKNFQREEVEEEEEIEVDESEEEGGVKSGEEDGEEEEGEVEEVVVSRVRGITITRLRPLARDQAPTTTKAITWTTYIYQKDLTTLCWATKTTRTTKPAPPPWTHPVPPPPPPLAIPLFPAPQPVQVMNTP